MTFLSPNLILKQITSPVYVIIFLYGKWSGLYLPPKHKSRMSEILKSKKGFILHKDSLSILNKMSDEQAGILFKAIYQYQTTGKTPDLEFGLEMAITPFINQFIRDDNAWEEERNKKAVNGFLGNLKRWHPDLYKKYNNDQITIEEAEKIIAERQSAIGGDSQPSDTIPNIANIAVNVSDSVNVSVKDSVSDNVNENKPIVQKENPFADMTKEFLQVRYKQMGKNKAITQRDFDNIRKLIEIDLKNRDNPVDDVKKAMDCVNENSDKEYFPIIESSKAFRDKFTKIESYMKRNGISNQQNPISKEEDKIQKLRAINEIAGQKLFSYPRQLSSNKTTVFLFMQNDDDEKALRSLPEDKKDKIRGILSDMLINKKLEVQIAPFHLD